MTGHNHLDLGHLLGLADPILFAREQLGFHPEPKQAEVLSIDARRGILCCHRQWGKSTTCAAKAIHHAVMHNGAFILIVAPTIRQGAELLRAVERFARKLGLEIRGDGANRPSLQLHNGSRVVVLPADEDNIRGFAAVSLILIDEAARVPCEVYYALLPMLSTTDGGIWLLSTPRGKTGFFYETWISGDPSWTRIHGTIAHSPRITAKVLADQRNHLPESVFRQEYHCEFGDTEDQAFRANDIDAALTTQCEPLARHVRALPTRQTTLLHYFLGIDLGKLRDYSAIVVAELHVHNTSQRDPFTYAPITATTLRVRHCERLPLGTPYNQVANAIESVLDLPEVEARGTCVIDATGVGQAFVDFLRASNLRLVHTHGGFPTTPLQQPDGGLRQRGRLCPVTITSTGRPHFNYDAKSWYVSKLDLITNLQLVLEHQRLEISSRLPLASTLRNELLSLRRDGDQFEPATSRGHDDLVLALALAVWRATQYRKDLTFSK